MSLQSELKYWKGVVRGARSELHEAGRITDEEYAKLCEDSEARDYVDRIDTANADLTALRQRLADVEKERDEARKTITWINDEVKRAHPKHASTWPHHGLIADFKELSTALATERRENERLREERDAWQNYFDATVVLDDIALNHPDHQKAVTGMIEAAEALAKLKPSGELSSKHIEESLAWALREGAERESEVGKLTTQLAAALAQVEGLRRDAEAFRFLEEKQITVMWFDRDGGYKVTINFHEQDWTEHDTIRAAISAATRGVTP
jgi:hypothetical protein